MHYNIKIEELIMGFKIKKTLLISGLLFGSFFAGCSDNFLEVSPADSLPPDKFYRNAEDAESAVNAAYDPLQDIYNLSYPNTVQGASDDVKISNNVGVPLNTWSFSANFSRFDEVWQSSYQGIFRSNLVLQNVPDIDMDETMKNRILGEARFLRALYYWHLTTLFGQVPLVKKANPIDPSVGAVAKSPVNDIYSFMISDLTEAINMLPLRSEYTDENIGRATKGAAQSLLGKIYLYDENYSMAQKELESVILSQEYELVDNFSDINTVDNNRESIFEVQYSTSPDEDNNRLEYNLPQGHGGYGNRIPLQNLVNEFEDYNGPSAINGKDPRLFHSIFRDGDPYDGVEPEFNANWTSTGFAMKKGQYPVTRGFWDSPWNEVLIRLADVYLMAAEAANENGNPVQAIKWINKVRSRVGMPTYPNSNSPYSVSQNSSKQEIFKSIVHERRVELAFESHRLNDLRRWGLAEQELGEYGYKSPMHRYFPIPQEEVDANPELDQNENYIN